MRSKGVEVMADGVVRFYTRRELADALRVCQRTVDEWIRQGALRKVPGTGRRVLVAVEEVERFSREGPATARAGVR